MRRFEEIRKIAAKRKGGAPALAALLEQPLSEELLPTRREAKHRRALVDCEHPAESEAAEKAAKRRT